MERKRASGGQTIYLLVFLGLLPITYYIANMSPELPAISGPILFIILFFPRWGVLIQKAWKRKFGR